MQVDQRGVTVLADAAERVEEIDEARAQEARRRAETRAAVRRRYAGARPGAAGAAARHRAHQRRWSAAARADDEVS